MWGTVSGDASPVSQRALSKWSCRLENVYCFLKSLPLRILGFSLWILSGQHFKNVSLMFLCVTEFSRALMNIYLAVSHKLQKLLGGLDRKISRGPFQPCQFCDSVNFKAQRLHCVLNSVDWGFFWVWKAFCPVDLALLCRVLSRETWNKALVSGRVHIHGFPLQGWLRGAVCHPHPLGTAASCHIHGQAAAVAREEVCVQHRGTQGPPALCFLQLPTAGESRVSGDGSLRGLEEEGGRAFWAG